MKWDKLDDVFSQDDIEWRISRAGKKGEKIWATCLAYVTNRAIQDRLDSVCGKANWKNEFVSAPSGGVLCGISILNDESGEWITKWDGAENSQIEPVKGGISGSMKRAAVQWGIGRYLYHFPEKFAIITETGQHYQPADKKSNRYPAFKWNPPPLPSWAVPADEQGSSGGAETRRQDKDITQWEDLVQGCRRLLENGLFSAEEKRQFEEWLPGRDVGDVQRALSRFQSLDAVTDPKQQPQSKPQQRTPKQIANEINTEIDKLNDPAIADGFKTDARAAWDSKDPAQLESVLRKVRGYEADAYKNKELSDAEIF